MSELTNAVRIATGVAAACTLVSCAAAPPPAPGYREPPPDPCALVRPETAVRLVGSTEPQRSGYQPPDRDAGSGIGSQACEWRNIGFAAAPEWGRTASVVLRVDVALNLRQDGSPDAGLAKTGTDLQFRDKRMQAPPPGLGLGDQSGQLYHERLGLQRAVFYFREANAEITISYQGMGSHDDGSDVRRPPEELERTAHDVAAEALQRLGPPR
ncbi:hypothetical protein GCM10025787_15020 [Saccharopolyspora rosea]|uniref:hypothetical protein n=1 Tax=Saccharopolyspora rosea TaxID=524884 RepID=UPI0031EF12E8